MTENINFKMQNIPNIELLDEQVRSALGAVVQGISVAGVDVAVHVSSNLTRSQLDILDRLIDEHEPTGRTTKQERAQRLMQLREQNSTLLDMNKFTEVDPNLLLLAEKIAWLELELAARQ